MGAFRTDKQRAVGVAIGAGAFRAGRERAYISFCHV